MTSDVRQVVARLRERHGELCNDLDGMESGDAEVLRLAADALDALASPSAPSGWQQIETCPADRTGIVVWTENGVETHWRRLVPHAPSGWQQRIAAIPDDDAKLRESAEKLARLMRDMVEQNSTDEELADSLEYALYRQALFSSIAGQEAGAKHAAARLSPAIEGGQNAKDALPPSSSDWQGRVQEWMLACFGQAIATDRLERCDRFCEEAIELLQSFGYPRERVVALIDYVFGRYPGESTQEVGGVMVTLAALCSAHGIDVDAARETELARVWTKVDQIREKQKAKPTGSALPVGGPRSRAALPSVSEASPAKPRRDEARRLLTIVERDHDFSSDDYDALRDFLIEFLEADPSPAKDPIADAERVPRGDA